MENLDPLPPSLPPPPPPKSRVGKWRVFAVRAASSLIWGDGGLVFHFILSKIAGVFNSIMKALTAQARYAIKKLVNYC